MLLISNATYIEDYRVSLAFSDGREGAADLRAMVFDDPRPAFAPLRDVAHFRRFVLEGGTLHWPGDLDIAPEYLYFLTFRDDLALRARFEEWGYLKAHAAI